MYEIKFKDNKGNKFTYTTFTNVNTEAEALVKYNWYIEKRFNCPCEILEVRKIIWDIIYGLDG